jgi:hypothetical protein
VCSSDLGFIVNLDLFGAGPGFAFKLLSRHEEIEQGRQRLINGGQEGLLLEPFKPVIPDILADDRAVFLLYEAVVVFLVVAASGEKDEIVFAPYFRGVIDKLRAVIAVKLQDRDDGRGFDLREGIESPLVCVIEEGVKLYPA